MNYRNHRLRSEPIEGTVYDWKCGACGRWNKSDRVTCSKCGADHDEIAIAYRLSPRLHPTEETFYTVTAVQILKELRAIRTLLEYKEIDDDPV